MLTLLRLVSRWSVWISGGLLLLSAVLVALEVLMRSLFQYSFGGVDEISSYIFATGVAWSLAFTLLHRAHIRIDLVYAKMPSSYRAALDILALASLIAVTALMFQQAFVTTSTSFELNSRSNTPLGIRLWIPQSIWTAGLGFFLIVQAFLLARISYLFLKRQHRQVSALTGVKTIDEEIDHEIRA